MTRDEFNRIRFAERLRRHKEDLRRSLDPALPWYKRIFYRLRWWWA